MNGTIRTIAMALCVVATATLIGCNKGSGSNASTKNDLKEIHMAHTRATQKLGRPPATPEDLKDLNPAIRSRIPGDYVVVWDIDFGKADAFNTLLAYESKVPQTGGYGVTLTGNIKNISAEEFKNQKQARAGVAVPQKKVNPNVKPKTGLARAFQIQEVQNLMKQVGLAYHNCCLTLNKAPSNYKDLMPFYDKNPKITKMLTKGYWKFHYNVGLTQMRNGTSNTVLAYESYPDRNGNRIVLFGDASVRLMPDTEFQKKPKAGQN